MKISLSLHQIIKNSYKTFLRFPLVIVFAAICVALAMYMIELRYQPTACIKNLTNYLFSAYLCALFLISWTIFAENKQKTLFWGGQGLIVLLGFVFYKWIQDVAEITLTIRVIVLTVAFHLLVAVAPFIEKMQLQNAFWQYNQRIFIHFLLAALYSQVLYAGITIAIAALDVLFGIKMGNEVYAHLFFIIAGLFNTLFFLSGVPHHADSLEQVENYPKGLKVFTQFVLLPLVVLYLLILYAYMAKIIVLWQLPQGWVSYMVLSFSIAGIFSLLLIEPIKSQHIWIKTFSRWFYVSLLPLVVLLFVSIGKRIADYGITENRYYVLLLALWLLGISLYFLLSASKKIIFIPISIAVLSLMSILVYPLSVFYVSLQSQLMRFESVWKTKSTSYTFEQRKTLSAVLDFLAERKQLEQLSVYTEANLAAILADTTSNESDVKKIAKCFQFEYIHTWVKNENDIIEPTYLSFQAEIPYKLPLNVENYQYYSPFQLYGYEQKQVINTNDVPITLQLKSDSLSVSWNNEPQISWQINTALTEDKDKQPYILKKEKGIYNIFVVVERFYGNTYADSVAFSELSGQIFVRKAIQSLEK